MVVKLQAKRQKLLEERRLAAAINKETLPDHLSDEEDDEEVRGAHSASEPLRYIQLYDSLSFLPCD